MSSISLNGDTSGSILIQAPAVAGSGTLTLPTGTATLGIQGPAFAAYQATSQTGVGNTVAAKITFDTEIFDTASCFSSSRFTPTVAGYYQINVCVSVGTTTTSHGIQAGIYKNGSQYVWGGVANANSAIYPYAVCSTVLYLNGSTDYVEGYVYGNLGGTYSILNGSQSTWFNGCLLRGA